MRGRRPERLTIAPRDADALYAATHSGSLPWFQVQRAKIVLAIATGEHQSSVAARLECDEATVWRTCPAVSSGRPGDLVRRWAARQHGSPAADLPGATGTDRGTGLPGTDRQGVAHHALVRARIWPVRRWPTRSSLRSARPRSAASCTMSICSPIGLGTGRRLGWTTDSRSGRSKSSGATGMRPGSARQGIWVVCADEIPTFQVLERDPIRRAIPGSIEQREFDYTRHGTVNMLVFLVVHSGLMELSFLAKNDAEHYLSELELFRKHHRELRGVFLIQDGGIEPYSGRYAEVLRRERRMVRPRYTPANASVVEPRGDPDPLVQALLPEAGVLEEPGGVQEPRAGLLARIQPPLRPSHRMDMDEPEDATMVRQACPEFIARVVSGDTRATAS